MGGGRDFRRFALSPMIAPQVVLAERLQILANRNYRRARGIESDRLYLISCDAGFPHRLTGGGGQGSHVIFVRLGGVFRVFALAVQGVFGNG